MRLENKFCGDNTPHSSHLWIYVEDEEDELEETFACEGIGGELPPEKKRLKPKKVVWGPPAFKHREDPIGEMRQSVIQGDPSGEFFIPQSVLLELPNLDILKEFEDALIERAKNNNMRLYTNMSVSNGGTLIRWKPVNER